MLFKSAIITQGSGSCGGLTLSRNRAGMYFRARVVPVDPATHPQVYVRNILGSLAAAWQDLTDAQREAWTVYATNVPVTGKLGDPLTLTGQQMYIRCNAARMRAGYIRVDDGPILFAMDTLSPIEITVSEATGMLDVTFDITDKWVDENNAGLILYGSIAKSPTVNFFKGPYHLAGDIPGDAVTPPSSPDNTVASYFHLTEGNAAFFRYYTVRDDGRISPVQRQRIIVDA